MLLPHPLQHLRDTLRTRPLDTGAVTPALSSVSLRAGAVLILIYPLQSVPHLVLTLRPAHLRRHAGQISLPGGGYEAGDGTLLTTALRETEEELGVPREVIDIWGTLDHSVITVSQYHVTPFVGYAQQRPSFVPDPGEVAEVIEVPLTLLTDAGSLQEELRELSAGARTVSYYPWGPHKIWGATARVLGQLARVLDADARQPLEL